MDVLIELCELVFAPWDFAWSRAAPATESSVAHILTELNVVIPNDFIALSQKCPAYGGWFASIGENYSSPYHIIQTNQSFRENEQKHKALPSHLIVLNHGYDGDCDCWDKQREPNANGEFPIVYYEAASGQIQNPVYDFPSFASYIEYFCLAKAKEATPPRRKKIRELLALYEFNSEKTHEI